MNDMDTLDDFGAGIAALGESLGQAVDMAAAFDGEMRRIHDTFSASGQGAVRLADTLSKGLGKAIDGVVLDGMKLSDALRTVANAMIDAAWKAAVKPVTDHVGGLIAGGMGALFGPYTPFAQGGSFVQGRVMPFATGGVVTGPVSFPMRGGMGLMGEAGPEAIMPLARGADGKLGVRAQSGGGVTVVMNITTSDAGSFQQSRSQIAAQMGRALTMGARNR